MNTRQEEVILYRVRDISLTISLWQRIFRVGSVLVQSSDKSLPRLLLKNIREPRGVKELIHKQVEEMKLSRRMRTTELLGGQGQEDAGPYYSALQAIGMDGLFPTWHLDGFTSGNLEITELYNSVSAHVTYFGEDRTYSVVIQHFTQPQSNTGTFEKDDTPVEEYDHNGEIFYILSNLDSLTATTYDGEYMTMISGILTREEIKAVIDSIPSPQTP